MNLDLSADPEPIAPRRPPPAKPTRTERDAFVLTPLPGQPNRWTYKGEIVRYNDRKPAVAGRGRWSNVEGVGRPEVRGEHAEVCRAIDARHAAKPSNVDCGECPMVSTGRTGTCMKAP